MSIIFPRIAASFAPVGLALAGAFGLILALTLAAPALAHPHVWVTGATTLHFQNDLLTRVGMRWQFDPFFSQVLSGDFDTNQDGKLDAEETEAMKQQVFTSLREYGYFTHLQVNGAEAHFDRVENFSTAVEKGELIYIFDLVLPQPVDVRQGETLLSVFDPTIYVDIVLGGDTPITLEGVDADKCSWAFAKGDEINSADGFLTPQIVKLSCKS